MAEERKDLALVTESAGGGARGGMWGWSLVCAVCQAALATLVCCEITWDRRGGSQVLSFAHESLIGWVALLLAQC